MGGFRIERLVAAGSTGAVYEATQVSLRRAVAVRLIPAERFTTPDQLARFDERQRRAASLHHPNLVPCYEFGEWHGGRFIATRLIRGKTLAELHREGSPPAAESMEPLGGALGAAHAAGLVHGRISEENVLVEPDGTPYLADLGLDDRGSPAADVQALAAVLSRLPAQATLTRTRRARRALRFGAAGLVAAVAAAVALAVDRDDDPGARVDPPPSPPSTTVVGSALAPAAVRPLGCRADPSDNTPACTLVQTTLGGRALRIRRAGVVRSWAVRGASGDLSLQVIREREGKSFVAAFSQPERLVDPAPRAFPARIAVRPGDRIGVRLAPGAAIGSRSSSPRSTLVRWDGGLTADSRAVGPTALEGELMLRADVEFGTPPERAEQLLGRQAASAPAGRPLADVLVALSAQGTARAVLVELPEGIALDVVRNRRLARLPVPDANPSGELLDLTPHCGPAGARGFCVRWRNPGDEVPLVHTYTVTRSGRIEPIG